MMYLALQDETRSGSGLPDTAAGKGQHRRVDSVSASRAPAVGAGPGEHTAATTPGAAVAGGWGGAARSRRRRCCCPTALFVLVDVAVFVLFTDLYTLSSEAARRFLP